MGQLTEKLKIRIDENCQQGLFLEWINDYSGRDCWLFREFYELQYEDNIESSYKQNYFDTETATGTTKVQQKSMSSAYMVNACVDYRNKEGFLQMFRSKDVRLLTNLVNLTWVDVSLKLKKWSENYRGEQQILFQFEIYLPEKLTKY